jgi:hypothetical protein
MEINLQDFSNLVPYYNSVEAHSNSLETPAQGGKKALLILNLDSNRLRVNDRNQRTSLGNKEEAL